MVYVYYDARCVGVNMLLGILKPGEKGEDLLEECGYREKIGANASTSVQHLFDAFRHVIPVH